LAFSFADYLCNELIQQQDLSLSCKENEDPANKPSKPSNNMPAPLQKLSDNKKDTKNAKLEDDYLEDDDDVFQQYIPKNIDSDGNPAQNLQLPDNSGQVKGPFLYYLNYFILLVSVFIFRYFIHGRQLKLCMQCNCLGLPCIKPFIHSSHVWFFVCSLLFSFIIGNMCTVF